MSDPLKEEANNLLAFSMFQKFMEWNETYFQMKYGFSYQELCRQEQLIARLYAASKIPEPFPGVQEELERATRRYQSEWLARRQQLDDTHFYSFESGSIIDRLRRSQND